MVWLWTVERKDDGDWMKACQRFLVVRQENKDRMYSRSRDIERALAMAIGRE